MWTFGILGKLDEIENETSRFYAYIGLCVSTSAGIEYYLFHCFRSASPLDENAAIKEFYKNVKFQRKRELADAAVRRIVSGTTKKMWDEIIEEVQRLCGPDGARNLVSHNDVGVDLFLPKQGVEKPPHLEMSVQQNKYMVAAGLRDPKRTTLESLRLYAGGLSSVHLRLIDFYQTHLANRK
ncbi:MAG: hypothetical protein H5U13_00380 [Parvibaculum sp.]|nr:hypothetical protein [Parvibaculum sp.]